MAESRSTILRLILATGVLYVAFLLYMVAGLKFQMLSSDVLIYWKQSLNWRVPFNTWWVPGYPLLIALLRGLTLNLLPPLVIMSTICMSAYLLAVLLVYRFGRLRGYPAPANVALLFAVFPFVGLTCSVQPLADISAIALLLAAIVALESGHCWQFVVFAGATMFFQKVMWFFVPPLFLMAFVRHKDSRILLPLAFAPVLLWIVAGAAYYHDPAWFMRWSVENLLTSKSSLPLFDGLIGPLLSGSWPRIAKSLVVATIFALDVGCLVMSVKYRLWLALCISLPFLAMTAVVNSYEIWVVVRYGGLLTIPVSMVCQRMGLSESLVGNRVAITSICCIGIVTNLAFGYYMARIYHA